MSWAWSRSEPNWPMTRSSWCPSWGDGSYEVNQPEQATAVVEPLRAPTIDATQAGTQRDVSTDLYICSGESGTTVGQRRKESRSRINAARRLVCSRANNRDELPPLTLSDFE